MKVSWIKEGEGQQPEKAKKKKLPMDRDPEFLAELRRDIIRDHNAKFDKQK